MGRPRVSLKERFFNQTNTSVGPECWQWLGCTDKDGYGKIRGEPPEKKNLRAHRVSYEIHIGNVPNDKLVCHKCDKPSCVNPNHLYLGTAIDNNRDTVRRNRVNPAKGSNHWSRRTKQIRDAKGKFSK